jgi:uncharacterized protein DUF6632
MTTRSDGPLRTVLTIIGLIFVFGAYPLTVVWPSGWIWHPHQPTYLHMILAVYAVLGIFLLLAARNPRQHLSLIWFTVWSSVAHAAVMAVHAFTDPGELGHLTGDVPALFLVAILLALVTPRRDTVGPPAA